jgi:hypothetical protein
MWAKLERGQAKDAKRAEKQQRWLERSEQLAADEQRGHPGFEYAEAEDR